VRVTLEGIDLDVNGHSLVAGITLEFDSCPAMSSPPEARSDTKTSLSVESPFDNVPGSGLSCPKATHLTRHSPWNRSFRWVGTHSVWIRTSTSARSVRSWATPSIHSIWGSFARGRSVSCPAASSGEQQRVAIARVLAQGAPLVLLDEPTTALDIAHRASVMALIEDLSPKGHTVFAVLHDLNMATHFDQVVLLHEGRMVASGGPNDVLTSDALSTVYSHPIDVVEHPKRPGLLVLPRGKIPASPHDSE